MINELGSRFFLMKELGDIFSFGGVPLNNVKI